MNNTSSGDQCDASAGSSQTLLSTILLLIGVCGILGNIFIIILATKLTAWKNLHHLIVNIAIADTIVVLSTFALEVPIYFDEKAWKDIYELTGNTLCKILSFILSIGIWLTLVTLFIITIERYRVTTALHLARSYSKKERLAALGACWVFVIIVSSHELYHASIVSENRAYYCNYMDPTLLTVNITLLAIATPLYITIITLGLLTLKRLLKRENRVFNLSEIHNTNRRKRMANALKLIFSSLFLYMGCYLPKIINSMLDIVDQEDEEVFEDFCYDEESYYYMLTCLPLANSCFSPVIYLVFMSDFRRAAKKIFQKESKRQTRIAVLGINVTNEEATLARTTNIMEGTSLKLDPLADK